jgi:hypothetical protein
MYKNNNKNRFHHLLFGLLLSGSMLFAGAVMAAPADSVGNFVWYDLNANGLQNAGEPGVGGVTINLYDPGPNNVPGGGDDVLLNSTTSQPSGAYTFTSLTTPDDYFVEFVAPSGLTFTLKDVGSNDTIDSDANASGLTAVFTLSASEANVDIDAGLHPPTTIGNFVWNDLDADGVQDGGEPGLGGVTVDLFTSSDTPAGSTTTLFNGSYSFSGIPAGDYYVKFSAPAGFTFSPQDATLDSLDSDADEGTGKTAVFSIAASTSKDDVDAGLFQSATIGNFVWNDLNGDGIQDGGEIGISGVAVTLYDSLDSSIGSTTTDASGYYTFTNLIPNTYYLHFTKPGGYITSPQDQGSNDSLDSDIDTGTGKTANFSVVFGQLQGEMDAGYFLPGSIGDFIWNDLNGDGVQDIGETGIAAVTVDLIHDLNGNSAIDGGEPILSTQITNGAGAYDFTNLPVRDYIIDVTDTGNVLTGYVLTGGTNPLAVSLSAGQDYNNADFGYRVQNASIGDTLWNDLNGDGVQDIGELGINGVTIDLIDDLNGNGAIDGGEPVLGTQTTNGSGGYDFPNLAAGKYIVDVTDTSNVLTGFALTGGTDPRAVTITAGQDYNGADFGYQQQDASIGDFLWNDLNGDGVQDIGELGIANVTIRLVKDLNGNGAIDGGEPVLGTQTTNGSGGYDFTGLAANNYIVDVTDTSNVLTGFALTGGTDPRAVTITAGQDYNGADFGYQQQDASIGDLVWNDKNGNNVLNIGEPPIQGVTIDLIDDLNSNGVIDGGEPVLSTKTTTSGGVYDFTGLAAGDYIVHVTDISNVLAGFVLTGGSNPLAVTITAGQDYNNGRFGYRDSLTASIGDYVWIDLNGDGVQDIGEPAAVGVTVDLIDDLNGNGLIDGGEPVLSTDTTDGSGAYDFTGLAGDKYIVDVTDTGAVLTGYVLTGGTDPLSVTISAAQDYNDADFGYKDPETGTIGNIVWNDRDGDGVQENGEPGISGVTINLTGAGLDDSFGTGDDVTYPAQTSGSDGAYDFGGLISGKYRIDVLDGSLPSGLTLTGGSDPLTVTISVAEDYNVADFGYQGNASVGDYVWHDKDGEGDQDISESGLAGIVIFLDVNGNGSREASEPFDDTNASGLYLINGLYANTYSVEVDESTVPANYILDTVMTSSVALTVGENYINADFGFVESYSAFLPFIVKKAIVAPDLVVTRINATNNLIEVVIKNQGNSATSSGFWVDFYVKPSPVPTAEDQVWQDVSSEGIVWGVNVPIAAGGVLTLTYSTNPSAPNLYYSKSNSYFTGTMQPGTAVYAQVDSSHLATSYGGVLENHEISGDTYNNISGSTVSALVVTAVSQTAVYISNEDILLTIPSR